jgi:multidrug efflux pump subunit AcrA (membrane-fusion protein)
VRKYLVPVVILLVLLGGAALIFFLLNNSSPATTTTYTVRRGTLSAVVRSTGKLEASRNTKLSFRNSDPIKKIYVKPGDRVLAGTLLMEQDDSRLQRELAQAEAQREIARLNLSAAQERGRYQAATAPTPTASPPPTPTLSPNFTPSPVAIPPISDQYVAVRQADQAEQGVVQARANLENAKIYAPYDGTVLTVDANEGDVVGYGAPVMTFADLSGMQVRADVDEIDVANVAVGQSVQLTLDAFPGKSFEGRVSSIAPSASQRSGSTVYSAIVNFTKTPDVFLRPGMAASLSIVNLTKNNILLVPNRALETIGSRRYVTRITGDNQSAKVAVETGLTNGDQTEIASGLNEGDKISVPR